MAVALAGREAALADLLRLVPTESHGLRVLEIDTEPRGGASAALLADRLEGSVVSVSLSSSAIGTARAARANDDRLQFRRASLISGWALGAPYDLVLAWPFMTLVPRAWAMQCAPGGLIICPVYLHRPVGTLGIVRLTVDRDGLPCLPGSLATPARGSRPGSVRWNLEPAAFERDGDGYAVSCARSGARMTAV
jgi:protein-L-isoaspartate O-methyltransferase